MKGKQADVILAAYNAAEVALRLVRPGAEVCPETNFFIFRFSFVNCCSTNLVLILSKVHYCCVII